MLRHIKSFRIFRIRSFKSKIFVAFILTALPLNICLITYMLFTSYNWTNEDAKQRLQQTTQSIKSQIGFIVDDTLNTSRSIIMNEDVQVALKQQTDVPEGLYNSLSNSVYMPIINKDYIANVILTNQRSVVYSTNNTPITVGFYKNIQKKWWFDDMLGMNPPFIWIPQSKSDIFLDEISAYEENNVALVRKIVSTADYKTLIGHMMIYLNADYFNAYLDDIALSKSNSIFVFNSSRNCLFAHNAGDTYTVVFDEVVHKNRFMGNPSTSIQKFNGVNYVLSWDTMNRGEWKIISMIPLSDLSDNFIFLRNQIIFLVILMSTIFLLISLLAATNISRAIKNLAEVMDWNTGHEDQWDVFDGKLRKYQDNPDEIGIIYRSYVELTKRFQLMIKENYMKDIQNMKSELALLESQINPHFLYNTLDSINWMALAGGQNEIAEMVTALSDTFRFTLNKRKDSVVKLKDELQHIQNYLTIQKVRFGDRLNYVQDISPETYDLYMVRFTLQPLIENALEHGINKLDHGGSIYLKTQIEDNTLIIEIANDVADAATINLETIERLLVSPVVSDMAHYGIYNINKRIHLLYGSDYGLTYSLDSNCRLLCAIMLPVCYTADEKQGG